MTGAVRINAIWTFELLRAKLRDGLLLKCRGVIAVAMPTCWHGHGLTDVGGRGIHSRRVANDAAIFDCQSAFPARCHDAGAELQLPPDVQPAVRDKSHSGVAVSLGEFSVTSGVSTLPDANHVYVAMTASP